MKLLIATISICAAFWSAPAWADCLSRTVTDETNATQTVTVAVPASEVGDYRQKGYAPATCESVDKAARREEICQIQASGNNAVQKRFEDLFGMAASRLCSSARLEAGITAATPQP